MDARELILSEIYGHARRNQRLANVVRPGFTWEDQTFLRASIIRLQHGDVSAWGDFIDRLEGRHELVVTVRMLLEERGWVWFDPGTDCFCMGAFSADVTPLEVDGAEALLRCLSAAHNCAAVRFAPLDEPRHLLSAAATAPASDQLPSRPRESRSEIMYIESKPGLTGHARIGRVSFSKTGKTIYYGGQKFRSLRGAGYKANFQNVDTGCGTGFPGVAPTGRTRSIRGSLRLTTTSARNTG